MHARIASVSLNEMARFAGGGLNELAPRRPGGAGVERVWFAVLHAAKW